jgi:hypothetical protein
LLISRLHVEGWVEQLLAKKGVAISVLDRVRQVGPNKTGAKDSYTVYRVTDLP